MRYLPGLTFVVSPSHIANMRNQVGLSITFLSDSIRAIVGNDMPLVISTSTSAPLPSCADSP